jgi:hypothetical protein
MCRALKVLCVARDRDSLLALKRAAVSVDWELTAGATDDAEALRQLHEDRPHVVVVFGPFERFVAAALDAYPALRVIADREMPRVTAVIGSVDEVRDAVLGRPRRGPVR